MLGGTAVGNKQNKPVAIAHMRLDHAIAVADRDVPRIKHIKEINAYLGSAEYALTAKRLAGSPMYFLIEKGSAKGEELMAAQEIELAFMALAGGLMFKPLSLEKTSPGVRQDWSAKTANAVSQYQSWANHWSNRRKSHLDHTLECVIAAVIDQRPIRAIGEDLGFHHRKIERAVLGGLRDYAARAGWVDGKIARQWMDTAEQTFNRGVAA